MKKRTQKEHPLDFPFAFLLFLLFTCLGLTLILAGAKVYETCSRQLEGNYTIRTAMAYVTEKIRQGDEEGKIRLSQVGASPALKLSQEIQEETYDTYIYEDEGYLKELLINSKTTPSPGQGTSLLKIRSFQLESLEGGFFRCTVSDSQGRIASALIHPQSFQEVRP